MNPSDDYKLTDLDYLVGDHHQGERFLFRYI